MERKRRPIAKRTKLFHWGRERCSSVCVQISFDPSKLPLDSRSVIQSSETASIARPVWQTRDVGCKAVMLFW